MSPNDGTPLSLSLYVKMLGRARDAAKRKLHRHPEVAREVEGALTIAVRAVARVLEAMPTMVPHGGVKREP